MRARDLERAILMELWRVTGNTRIEREDLLEWRSGDLQPPAGARKVYLPELQVQVAVKAALLKKKNADDRPAECRAARAQRSILRYSACLPPHAWLVVRIPRADAAPFTERSAPTEAEARAYYEAAIPQVRAGGLGLVAPHGDLVAYHHRQRARRQQPYAQSAGVA